MNLSEIIKDSISYPIHNIKSLLVYMVLGVLIGVVGVLSGISGIATGTINFGAGIVIGVIGIIVMLCIYFLMLGFSLDIIKMGISKSEDAPKVEFSRQIINGLKYIVVGIFYLIVPILIVVVASFIFKSWLVMVIGIVLAIIFAFLLVMGECRLAKTESLSQALSVGESISDLQEIGVGKVVSTMIVAEIVGIVVAVVISFIVSLILGLFGSSNIVNVIGLLISLIIVSWLLFYNNRVMGLLYSNKS